MGLNRNGTGPSGKDQRITSCKLCPNGIFNEQKWVWICDGWIGMVHLSCHEAFLRGEIIPFNGSKLPRVLSL